MTDSYKFECWQLNLTLDLKLLNCLKKRRKIDIRGRNKVYLFDWSFLVLMKITLQLNYWNLGFWWCSKSPIWSSNFTASFHHFSYKERPDLQKINLFTLLQYFSQKIPSSTVTLFPAPLKSKAVQGSQFRKASIPRVTQCHRTQTLHEIQSLWFIRLGY